MTYIELFILAVSLSFDTFAVSVTGGIANPEMKMTKKSKIMLFFALFQSLFLFAGWYVGDKFASVITSWDHWLAFLILLYIGGKMVADFYRKEDCSSTEQGMHRHPVNLLNTRKLVTLSIATSIDAVAVGISLAFIDVLFPKMCFAALITAVVTALAAFTGLTGGQKMGCYIGKKASFLGGIVLILIGVKILVEHLFL